MKEISPLTLILECEAAASAEIAIQKEILQRKISEAERAVSALHQQTEERISRLRTEKEIEFTAAVKDAEENYKNKTAAVLSRYEKRFNEIKTGLMNAAAERIVRRE